MSEQNDFTMAFQDSADQIPLVLIHGFPLDSTLWEMQFQGLEGMARVIAPDLRGHGRSDNPAGPYSMGMFADDINGLLDHLGVYRPVILCGLSMGGYIAFEFYRRYPKRVAGLILTATRAAADSKEAKANRDKAAESVKNNGIRPIVEAMLPKLMAPASYEDEELVAYVREMMEITSPEGMMGALQAMKNRPDSTPTLKKIKAPTLVIHGEEDQIIP
ncbi:MAG: alpha/beta fold hydrolase, partial [Anaerolineae bacterium]